MAQATESLGVLAIKAVNPDGTPAADIRIGVTLEFTGSGPRPKCPSGLVDKTGADGTLRLERMKPGPYSLQVLDDAGDESVQVTVVANQTAEVTLTKR